MYVLHCRSSSLVCHFKASTAEVSAADSRNKDDITPPLGAMSCYQCEQTLNNKACTEVGVCGKNPEVAALQVMMRIKI